MLRSAIAVCLLGGLLGCGASHGESPPASSDESAGATERVSGASDGRTDSPPQEQQVSFVAADGLRLSASLWAPRAGAQLSVVLVHQLGSDRREWRPFVEALLRVRPMPIVLALDLRGHGASVAEGRTWRRFGSEDWEKLPLDVAAALDFLASRPQLRTPRIVAVGSSIGGSAVFLTALHDRPYQDPRLDAVGWLSPGRAYHGLDVLSPASRYGRRPFAAFVAEGEMPAIETAEAFARILPKARVVRYPGSAHGVGILEDAPSLLQDVVAFVRDPDAFVGGEGGN